MKLKSLYSNLVIPAWEEFKMSAYKTSLTSSKLALNSFNFPEIALMLALSNDTQDA